MWIYEVGLFWDNNPEEVRASQQARQEAREALEAELFPHCLEPEDYDRLPEVVDEWQFVDSVWAFTKRGAMRKAVRLNEADRSDPACVGRVACVFQRRRVREAREALDGWRWCSS